MKSFLFHFISTRCSTIWKQSLCIMCCCFFLYVQWSVLCFNTIIHLILCLHSTSNHHHKSQSAMETHTICYILFEEVQFRIYCSLSVEQMQKLKGMNRGLVLIRLKESNIIISIKQIITFAFALTISYNDAHNSH